MTAHFVFSFLFILCTVLFFVAPHHRRKPESFKSCTLGEIYWDLLSEIPRYLKPETQVIILLGLTGIFASFYPAFIVLMIRTIAPSSEFFGFLFISGGILTLIGAAANFLAMLISHMNFSFGGASSTQDQTLFIAIIPILQLIFGIMSIAVGCSHPFAASVLRHIGN